MEIEIYKNPDEQSINDIRKNLITFNLQYLEVKDREKYLIKVIENNEMSGGIVFNIFGEWLEIEYLWLSEKHRGKGIGKKLIREVERIGKEKKCRKISLFTFSFQAKPFYEKSGFTVVHVQENYPITGKKYFMEKNI